MWPGKKIVYVDMDHVLCDFQSAYDQALMDNPNIRYPQSVQRFFQNLNPMLDAISSYQWLAAHPKLKPLILTAPSVLNPHCYIEKRLWVEEHLGMAAVDDLIISRHKGLNKGHYLIDDQLEGRGQDMFEGELIVFGSERTPDWRSVIQWFESQFFGHHDR